MFKFCHPIQGSYLCIRTKQQSPGEARGLNSNPKNSITMTDLSNGHAPKVMKQANNVLNLIQATFNDQPFEVEDMEQDFQDSVQLIVSSVYFPNVVKNSAKLEAADYIKWRLIEICEHPLQVAQPINDFTDLILDIQREI